MSSEGPPGLADIQIFVAIIMLSLVLFFLGPHLQHMQVPRLGVEVVLCSLLHRFRHGAMVKQHGGWPHQREQGESQSVESSSNMKPQSILTYLGIYPISHAIFRLPKVSH